MPSHRYKTSPRRQARRSSPFVSHRSPLTPHPLTPHPPAAFSFSAAFSTFTFLFFLLGVPAQPAPFVQKTARTRRATPEIQSPRISAADEAFLEDFEHRIFRYFWEQSDAQTGLVLDRTRADGSPSDASHLNAASIAATGFGLTGICIAADRHWVSEADARERIRATLRFFAERAPQEHGWFYHWLDRKSGARIWHSEVSSIDSALLLAGILTARQAFPKDAEIVRLATLIYDRVDFAWMLNGSPAILDHGWTPEKGFIRSRWDDYSEETILYLLAIGSRNHPITSQAWYAWERPRMTFEAGAHIYTYIGRQPLFTHQYSQAWVDYRNRREDRDGHIDYFENSVTATRAHRAFCIALAKKFPGYSENIWGITASDSINGYVAWGGPPPDPRIDGTMAPSAASGSLMFTPDISLPALRAMVDLGKTRFNGRLFGRYGFVDAFNPTTGWVDSDILGIDEGISLLSAEDLRSGHVWLWFMANPEVPRAMELVGLRKVPASLKLN